MIPKRYLYGMMGLLSLLGFIGIFTEEKRFLLFFAFVVDFEYFFKKSDEMLDEYMMKSASRAFFFGMITTALVTLFAVLFLEESGNEALVLGFAQGWSISIIVYSLSTAYFSFKENWVLTHDKE